MDLDPSWYTDHGKLVTNSTVDIASRSIPPGEQQEIDL
jgi:hypothetical protein